MALGGAVTAPRHVVGGFRYSSGGLEGERSPKQEGDLGFQVYSPYLGSRANRLAKESTLRAASLGRRTSNFARLNPTVFPVREIHLAEKNK